MTKHEIATKYEKARKEIEDASKRLRAIYHELSNDAEELTDPDSKEYIDKIRLKRMLAGVISNIYSTLDACYSAIDRLNVLANKARSDFYAEKFKEECEQEDK